MLNFQNDLFTFLSNILYNYLIRCVFVQDLEVLYNFETKIFQGSCHKLNVSLFSYWWMCVFVWLSVCETESNMHALRVWSNLKQILFGTCIEIDYRFNWWIYFMYSIYIYVEIILKTSVRGISSRNTDAPNLTMHLQIPYWSTRFSFDCVCDKIFLWSFFLTPIH